MRDSGDGERAESREQSAGSSEQREGIEPSRETQTGSVRHYMNSLKRWVLVLAVLGAGVGAGGCASTTITFEPSPQPPVCEPSAAALVIWSPQWRPDQKDVQAREQAAEAGLRGFLATSGCFAQSVLRRASDISQTTVTSQLAGNAAVSRVVGIEVRELGPVVKLLSSAALVEGGTEVVFRVIDFSPDLVGERRRFMVRWQNGGPGVVKGIASLPDDMQAALRAGLQSAGTQR